MTPADGQKIIDRIARLEREVERLSSRTSRMDQIEQDHNRLKAVVDAQRRWLIGIADAGGDPHVIESHGVTASLDFATFQRDGRAWDFPGLNQQEFMSLLWGTIHSQIPVSLSVLRNRLNKSDLDPTSILRGTDSIGSLIHRRAGGYFIPRGKKT